MESGLDDVMVLATAIVSANTAHHLAALADHGFDDLRFADGFVLQQVVAEPVTISELARRLGITQQGASKAVLDLERRGYVRRAPAPDDARARVVELTARGRAMINVDRRTRAAGRRRIERLLGESRHRSLRRALQLVAEDLGAAEQVRERRIAPFG